MELIIGILIGLAATAIGYVVGFTTYRNAFKSGANMIDKIRHEQVPFDDELNTESLASHVDGMSLDEEDVS